MKLTEIELELVGVCNAECGYCMWKEKPEASKTYMKPELAKSVLDQAPILGVEMIRYHAIGESTLHPQLIEILQYGLSHAPQIQHSLSTNCSMLQGRLAEVLAQLPIELILAVPWVDPRPEFVKRCAQNALAYLRAMPSNRIVRLQMVTELGAEKYLDWVLDEFWPAVLESPPAMMQFKAPVTWPGDPTPRLGFRPGTAENSARLFIDGLVPPVSIGRGCQMPERVLMVRANGETAPCCVSVHDWGTGNVNQMTLEAIWNSERMHEIRKMWWHADDRVPCGACKKRTDC